MVAAHGDVAKLRDLLIGTSGILPRSTEQKLKLVDSAVKYLKNQVSA